MRTSYHVGSPWILDGKMLRGETGTPMRRIAREKSSLAEADPEPLTLANLTTKSFTASIRLTTSASLLMSHHALFHAAFRCGPGLRQPGPAWVISTRYFCMSHAPVGQRSAHRPQC